MDPRQSPPTATAPTPPNRDRFTVRHQKKIAYGTLVVGCLLAISIIDQAITYQHKWINVRWETLVLAIVVAIHVHTRKDTAIPGIARATKIGMGCIVAFVLGMIALFLMVGPMG